MNIEKNSLYHKSVKSIDQNYYIHRSQRCFRYNETNFVFYIVHKQIQFSINENFKLYSTFQFRHSL